METCAGRCSQGSTLKTPRLFPGEVTRGIERLEHASHGATVSGVRELHCITHTEDIPTEAKLCPLRDVMERAERDN